MRPRTFKSAHHLLLVSLFLLGCSVPWGVRTRYFIADCPTEAQQELADLLADYGFEARPQAEEGSYVFDLVAVRTMEDLSNVRSLLILWSEHRNVPIALEKAGMWFASAEGAGGAKITFSGVTTPGSVVLLDLGGSRCAAADVSGGQWTFSPTLEQVTDMSKHANYVYGLSEKGNARAYFRFLVTKARSHERVGFDDLPNDSCLRTDE